MEFRGSVQGPAATKYAGFTYRKIVPKHIDMWQLDPERLNYADPYPRSVNPPSREDLGALEITDYVVTIGAAGADGMSRVQVWMLPNDFTAAKKSLLVYEFFVPHAFTHRREWVDEAIKRAFDQS